MTTEEIANICINNRCGNCKLKKCCRAYDEWFSTKFGTKYASNFYSVALQIIEKEDFFTRFVRKEKLEKLLS